MADREKKLKVEIEIDSSDLGKLQDNLKGTEARAQDAAGKIKNAFESTAKAIAALYAGNAVISFISDSVKVANNLEQAFLKVKQAAIGFGETIESVKNKTKDLSSDAVMSFEAVAKNFETLSRIGIDAQKSFDLQDALKKIFAVTQGVEKAEEKVSSVVDALQKGKAGALNALGSEIRGLIDDVGGLEKVDTDFAAKQALVNKIIEQGTRYTEAYSEAVKSGSAVQLQFADGIEEAQKAIGAGFAPAVNTLKKSFADLLGIFTEWFTSLPEGSKQIIVWSAAAMAMVPAIAGLISAAKGLAGAFTMVKLALGPVGWIMAALGGLAAIAAAIGSVESDAYDSIKSYHEKLSKELSNMTEGTEKYRKKKQELIELEKSFNNVLGDQVGLLERINQQRQTVGDENFRNALRQIANPADLQAMRTAQMERLQEMEATPFPARSESWQTDIGFMQRQLAAINAEIESRQRLGGGGGGGGPALKSDFLLLDLEKTLDGIAGAYDAFLAANKGKGKEAEAEWRRAQLELEAKNNYITQITKANQTELFNTLDDIETRKKLQEDQLAQLKKSGNMLPEELEKLAKDIEKSVLADRIDAFTRAIDSLQSAVFDFEEALRSGNIGGMISGGGGTLSAVGNLANNRMMESIGGAAGVVGSIVSGVFAIIDREEQARREAEQRRQELYQEWHERRIELLEAEAQLQQNLLNLEKEKMDLLKESKSLQERLIDLQDISELEAIKEKIRLENEYLQALGITRKERNAMLADLQGEGEQFTERQNIALQIQTALDNLQLAVDSKNANAIKAQYDLLRNLLPQAAEAGLDVSSQGILQNIYNGIYDAMKVTELETTVNPLTGETQQQFVTEVQDVFSSVFSRSDLESLAAATNALSTQMEGINNDLEKEGNILDSLINYAGLKEEEKVVFFSEQITDFEREVQAMEALGMDSKDILAKQKKFYLDLRNDLMTALGIESISDIPGLAGTLEGTKLEQYELLISTLEKIQSATEGTEDNTSALTTLDRRNISFLDILGGAVNQGVRVDTEAIQLSEGVTRYSLASISNGSPQAEDKMGILISITNNMYNNDITRNNILYEIRDKIGAGGGIVAQTKYTSAIRSRNAR